MKIYQKKTDEQFYLKKIGWKKSDSQNNTMIAGVNRLGNYNKSSQLKVFLLAENYDKEKL